MKQKKSICSATAFVFSFIFVISSATPLLAKGPQESVGGSDSAPSAVVLEPRFAFDSVVEGTEVVHEFPIQNKGGSVLKLNKVESGCGCTTADYTDAIQPSSTGRVVVKADTEGYGGSKFQQKITVHTNDPFHEKLVLEIIGDVKKFAEITPSRLMIKGSVAENLAGEVRIVPSPDFDFEIGRVETVDLENAVFVDIAKDSQGYLLTVKNQQTKPGIYVGKIVLKTDNNIKPEIVIPLLMGLTP